MVSRVTVAGRALARMYTHKSGPFCLGFAEMEDLRRYIEDLQNKAQAAQDHTAVGLNARTRIETLQRRLAKAVKRLADRGMSRVEAVGEAARLRGEVTRLGSKILAADAARDGLRGDVTRISAKYAVAERDNTRLDKQCRNQVCQIQALSSVIGYYKARAECQTVADAVRILREHHEDTGTYEEYVFGLDLEDDE